MRKLVILTLGMILIAGCTIKPPEVNITSEKTALEKQLLGTRERLTEDPFTTAAVWSAGGVGAGTLPQPETTAVNDRVARRELIVAQMRRQTVQGDIQELKKKGYLGEGNDGLLKVMSDTITGFQAVQNLAEAENHDRSLIMQFYSRSRGISGEAGYLDIERSFADAMIKVSPAGTWVQNADGAWLRK